MGDLDLYSQVVIIQADLHWMAGMLMCGQTPGFLGMRDSSNVPISDDANLGLEIAADSEIVNFVVRGCMLARWALSSPVVRSLGSLAVPRFVFSSFAL
ncbi:hypothetical protein TIFTF001_014185 [Ficus carica]|uniref:Uncharacterized protein n=1 Tax=Ficus carica TaxID=3494 RepID=A0AA87ZWB7_FICCA|nr:hypothetical protein TIFTF001_014185 [Ficus carica]